MDGVLGFLLGLFNGGLLGFQVAALIIASGRSEPEPDDGVDDVLDELTANIEKIKKNEEALSKLRESEAALNNLINITQNQPKIVRSEERMEDFKQKYPQE